MPQQHPARIEPKKEIDQVIEAEARNVHVTIRALGERRKLANDVLGLYDLLFRNTDLARHEDEQELGALLVIATLLNACRFQLTMSILQCWRGRVGEAFGPIRKASELCAVACHISKHPEVADAWTDASQSDEAYKRHKKAFDVKTIFPKSDPLLNDLYDFYDFSSNVVHASIFALANLMGPTGFNYFEIQSPGHPDLIRTFLYILRAHELMIEAFARALWPVLRDSEKFDKELRMFRERLQRHRDTNAEFAMSDVQPEILERLRKERRR
jgi:hypothetical protein